MSILGNPKGRTLSPVFVRKNMARKQTSLARKALSLEIQVEVSSWNRIPRLKARLKQAAQATGDYLAPYFSLTATATVLLTGNAKIRQLNHDFRGQNKPTNVLSFPQYVPEELRLLGRQKKPTEAGDIVLAYQYVVSEAKDENKLVINHVTHLVVHGLLHLFGYDHVKGQQAQQMEAAEIEILKTLGIPDPYAYTIETGHQKKI